MCLSTSGSLIVGICTLLAVPLLTGAGALSAGEPRELIANAEKAPAVWRYTTRRPDKSWTRADFDDSRWARGKAGFGTAHTPGTTIGTVWRTPEIWLRKELALPKDVDFQVAAMNIRHDEDVEVYVNGKPVFTNTGYLVKVTAYDVTRELKAAIRGGKNLVAVHVRQTAGGQYIDLGLVLDPKDKPPARIEPRDPAALQKLRASRWSPGRVRKWYDRIGPIRGCNYLPRTAVNTTELWQKESFDPGTIDQELGWAHKYGLNSVRVFVQYIVYEADADGLIGRMERFLGIAHKHEISVMFVLLDDCFKGEPKLGKQPDPVPGVHNSQWTSSPGNRRRARKNWPALEKYVKHVVGHFGKDKRVIVWDLYNEPKKQSRPLVEAVFTWARSVNPSQPLTTCWQANDLWDVASFHDYGPPNAERLARRVRERPAICTECIARTRNSRIETVLPAFAKQRIGWYMWGLVKGRIQTHYPWGSPKGAPEPELWFHDLLHPDGKPYRPGEIEYIRRFGDEFRKAKPKP